jgi:superfamily II DNA/RNA helicase
MSRQIDALKKERPAVIVGNPGRLLQLARMKKLRLDGVAALVLDEGDRLVADEIREETEALLRFLPPARQNIACSATFSAKNRERLFSLGGEWRVIEEDGGTILRNAILHWAFFAEDRKKISLLRSLLAAARPRKALVFTSRGSDAGNIVSQLQYHHLAAGGIWGDMDRKGRKAAMDGFRRGNLSILVASDLACRGLDIGGISHVIALDVPVDPELYLHRAGRTGRAGKRGIMASIGGEEEMRRLAGIEKKLGITVYPKALYGGRIGAADGGETPPNG